MTDTISITPLPLPQQPELYRGPIIIEAEDMDFKNIKMCTTNPYGEYPSVRGHAGNGFMDMGTERTGALRHRLKLKEGQEGDYVIGIRYSCSTKSGNILVKVNGASQSISCEKTDENEWKWVNVEANLTASTNDLIISNTRGLPLYIDQICYRPADVAPMTYFVDIKESEFGTITANKTEAEEGDTITLNISARYGYALKELRVINSVFYTMAKTIELSDDLSKITFIMPNDNVSIEPVFEDMNSVLNLDFSTVVTGAIPQGWRCVQENNEVHEYPNTFSLGARTMSGFTGYQGKALYWREECAEYGRQNDYPLYLEQGDYKLTYAMAAWKSSPKYKVSILDAETGTSVAASRVFTASPNADGNSSADVSSAIERNLPFSISTPGNYVISFTNESRSSGYDEYLLLSCSLRYLGDPDAIRPINAEGAESTTIYDLSGRQIVNARWSNGRLPRGINIVRTSDGKAKKIYVK
jgi:hypothetical protein